MEPTVTPEPPRSVSPYPVLFQRKRMQPVDRSFRGVTSLPPVRGSKPRSVTPVQYTTSPPKKRISKEQALLISLKNYKLPACRYPVPFETCVSYKNDKDEEIPLIHRDLVLRLLRRLDHDAQPVLSKFNLLYTALSECHPQRTKAAYTCRLQLKFDLDLPAFAHYIQIRVRSRQAPNDPSKLHNRTSLQALLFHELAHLRYMNHGVEFMFFLRDIFAYAHKAGVFAAGETHQVPSCLKWENRVFETAGGVSDQELLALLKPSPALDC